MTRRPLWGWVGVLAVVDVAVELPILASGDRHAIGRRRRIEMSADPTHDWACN
jgi:hypothetical protein